MIPPQEVWEPIQAIRRQHDRHLHRWMPHITIRFPFRPLSEFAAARLSLARACSRLTSFPITLATFRTFQHRPGSFTLWLAPEPPQPLIELEAALHAELPNTSRRPNSFTPHLSVGQLKERGELIARLQGSWRPLRFDISEIALLHCHGKEPFRVELTIPLGNC